MLWQEDRTGSKAPSGRGQGRLARIQRDCRGASAVEFALLAPVYLLLILGGIAYALYFGAAHSVQQLAADAARVAVSGLDAGERALLVERYIANHAGSYVLIDPDRLSVTAAPSPTDPAHFIVALRYDSSALPIWNLDVPLPASREIAFSSVVRNGGL